MSSRLLVVTLAVALGCAAPAESVPDSVPSTFSIAAVDTRTGEVGVAVQSRFIAVGAVVPWAKARVGAVATQSFANTTYGPEGLDLLASGVAPADAIVK